MNTYFQLKIMFRKGKKPRLVGDENLKLADLSPTKTILPRQKTLSGQTLYAEKWNPQ